MGIKLLFFTFFWGFISLNAFGQCFEKETLSQSVSDIIKSSLSDKQKLLLLYALKTKAETCNASSDTSYLLLLRQIAFSELENHHFDSAIFFTRAAINVCKTLRFASSDYAEDYSNMASFYYRLQSYRDALVCYDTAIILKTKVNRNNPIFFERYYRSFCYFNLGDYQRAVEESTTGMMSITTRQDSDYYLPLLNNRAQSFLFENRYPEALADIETTIHLLAQKDNHYELASAYKTKAGILGSQQKYRDAETLFMKAISERQLTKSFGQIASDFNDLGNFYVKSLHDYKRGRDSYQQAIRYARQSDDPQSRLQKLFMTYNNLAISYTHESRLTEAVSLYQQSVGFANISVPDFLHHNPSLRQLEVLENKDLVWSLLTGKTELLLQFYKKTKQPLYLQLCLQTARLTDSFVTRIRHEHVSEGSKLHWRDKTHSFFADAVEVCYLMKDAEDAFYFMEKSRAVLLNDKLNELGAASHLPAEEAAKEQSLEKKINMQQQVFSSLPATGKGYANAQYRFLQIKAEQERYIKTLEQKYPAYYQYKYDDNVPFFHSLRDYLSINKSSFIYYFASDSAIYILSIPGKQKPVFIKIKSTDFDIRRLSEFVQVCSSRETINHNYAHFDSLAQEIYTVLFKPLHLPKGNVAICSDAFFIPFEAISNGDRKKNFLLYDYRFSYVYSARSLIKPFAGSKADGLFVGFAPVSFSSGLLDLKGSASALEKSAGWYSDYSLFTNAEATRKNFFTYISRYSVVTIFSHAQADTTSAEPILYMSDSLIRLSELQSLRNPSAQIVLLSACQTNTGKNATGEGIYSLARGFSSAGIPAVSATLWKADEGAVYQISEGFNKYLSKGMNKSEALQQAKIDYLQSGDHEHTLPYYWANLVLIGSSQPVIVTPSGYLWYWIAGFIIFITGSSFYLVYRKRKKKKNSGLRLVTTRIIEVLKRVYNLSGFADIRSKTKQ